MAPEHRNLLRRAFGLFNRAVDLLLLGLLYCPDLGIDLRLLLLRLFRRCGRTACTTGGGAKCVRPAAAEQGASHENDSGRRRFVPASKRSFARPMAAHR